MAREGVRHRQVTAEVDMVLASVPGGLPVRARLRYTTHDPYALTMSFAIDESTPVEWVFGRDLLIAGLSRPSGVGDVQVFPSADRVVIDLASPDGTARIVGEAGSLIRFVAKMLAAVPVGAEEKFCDIDRELAALRGETIETIETAQAPRPDASEG